MKHPPYNLKTERLNADFHSSAQVFALSIHSRNAVWQLFWPNRTRPLPARMRRDLEFHFQWSFGHLDMIKQYHTRGSAVVLNIVSGVML